MSQLGNQKVRQKSEFSRPRPPTLAASCSGPGRRDEDKPPFDGRPSKPVRAKAGGGDRVTTGCAGLWSSKGPKVRGDLPLHWTLTAQQRMRQLLPYLGSQQQVHQVDQTWLPRCKVALLGAVPCICCAPRLKTTQKNPCDYKGHTLEKVAPWSAISGCFAVCISSLGEYLALDLIQRKEVLSRSNRMFEHR